ncbi:MAG: pentapeptide repeat-containing protein, partial [Moorea sp. SIO3I6]|nr:pentapeptide repeat-containing protein [Moorena sp. SIO3I6]
MSNQEIRPEAQPLIDRCIDGKTKDFLEIGRIAGLNTTSDCAGADL